jgi:hypothetical protein
MNPPSSEDGHRARCYKLNLQNLVTQHQPTIEFRQHSATFDFPKVAAWVRFLHSFVHNSAAMSDPPIPFRERQLVYHNDDHDNVIRSRRLRRLTQEFDDLFQTLIKDNALKLYYQKRMWALELERMLEEEHDDDNNDACCESCSRGRICERNA